MLNLKLKFNTFLIGSENNVMDSTVIENFIKTQKDFSKKWKGMEVNWIGRPGTNNIITGKRKQVKRDEYAELEDK